MEEQCLKPTGEKGHLLPFNISLYLSLLKVYSLPGLKKMLFARIPPKWCNITKMVGDGHLTEGVRKSVYF